MSQDRERILNSGLAAKGKVDLTLHLHKARANVVRFKTYRTESVIAHKSFFLIPMFIKLGYAGIRRHGVKAKPIKQGNTVRPGRGPPCNCEDHPRAAQRGQRCRATAEARACGRPCDGTEPQDLRTTLGMSGKTLSRPHPNRTEPALPHIHLTGKF